MASVDISELDKRIYDCEVAILCDVDNKLLGPQGAAAVFGPQKGADADTVKILETFLKNFAEIATRQTGIDMANLKHGGAAGGATAGLHVFLNAKLVNGINYFLTLTNFDEALKRADLVITGEGSIDEQTLQGKGPYGVALRAKSKNVPVIALAGSVPLDNDDQLRQHFNTSIPIGNEPAELTTALNNTTKNLIRAAKSVGDLLAIKSGR
jgi:glycerate kinase